MCKTTTPTSATNGTANGSQKTSNEIPANVPSGFAYYKQRMILSFVGLTILYFATIQFFDEINAFLQLPPSRPDLCPSSDPCWRADLFAFEVVSATALAWSGIIGFQAWHFDGIDKMIPNTPEGRLFGYLPQAHKLTAIGVTFQLFDLFISLLIPEQCQPVMLCHHTLAALVSWYGLNNQYFHYYGIFYLGCSEISTIPLLFLDVAGFFPPQTDTTFEFLISGICGPAFALTFTIYRVVLWWKVSRQLFSDIFYAQQTGIADKVRPNRSHVLWVMMIVNIVLGLLQLYWFRMILEEVLKAVGVLPPPASQEKAL